MVLVVDDHEDTRDMYVQFLDAVGYASRSATTCAEALAQARAGGIDAIILDRRLPDGDGVEVCRTIRSDARTRALPVIVLSGRAADGAVDADAYLMKPVVPEDLLQVLDRVLAGRGRGATS